MIQFHASKQPCAAILQVPGLINVDFADVRSIMHQAGNSHMASGTGVGEGRAEAAALAAIESPLLESSINSATGVVWNITGPMDLTIAEVDAAAALICACVDENANIIFGAVLDPDVQEEVCPNSGPQLALLQAASWFMPSHVHPYSLITVMCKE